jgi:TonB family protein
MNETASKSAAAIWNPPAPSTGRAGMRWQRVLSIGAVVAIHIVGIVMFAARPLGFRLPGDESGESRNVVYLASELMPPDPENALPGPAENSATALESDANRRARGDFIPPRLVQKTVPDAADFAQRAGLQPGKPARVVLAVKVSALGVPSDIQVASSSGNTQADALAIEYARLLRWNPAQEQGRNSIANIRLPVVLASRD